MVLDPNGLEEVLLAFGDPAAVRRAARAVAGPCKHAFIPGCLDLDAVPAALA